MAANAGKMLHSFLCSLDKGQRLEFLIRYLRRWRACGGSPPRPGTGGSDCYARLGVLKKSTSHRLAAGRTACDETYQGANFSDEQVEFMLSVHRVRERLGRQPTMPEVLAVAKSLGYAKETP